MVSYQFNYRQLWILCSLAGESCQTKLKYLIEISLGKGKKTRTKLDNQYFLWKLISERVWHHLQTRCNQELIQSQIKIKTAEYAINNSIWIWSEFKTLHSFLSIFPTENALGFSVYLFVFLWLFDLILSEREAWKLKPFLVLEIVTMDKNLIRSQRIQVFPLHLPAPPVTYISRS